MGLIKGFFDKLGHWHIKKLVKEGVELIINQLRALKHERDGKAHIGDALDRLIEEGGFSAIEKDLEDVQLKFSEYITYYVVRRLDRDVDFMSGENTTIKKEIDKYWTKIKRAKSFMNHG